MMLALSQRTEPCSQGTIRKCSARAVRELAGGQSRGLGWLEIYTFTCSGLPPISLDSMTRPSLKPWGCFSLKVEAWGGKS